jgi:hypothetical protein
MNNATPKIGEKVYFPRGMFGQWFGTLRRVYKGRGRNARLGLLAEVSYTRANGSAGRRSVLLSECVRLVPFVG